MRLTLVISSLGCGGAERIISILANCWAQRGQEVSVLTFDGGEIPFYPLHPAVRHTPLGLMTESSTVIEGFFRNLQRVRALRRSIRDSRPDVVISFVDKVNILTLLATRGLGLPVVVSERTDPAVYDIGRVWNRLRRRTYPFADALVCQSTAVLDQFCYIPAARKQEIPNPVLLPLDIQTSYGNDNSPEVRRLVVGMGRLVREKGFDLLLAAFGAVSGKYPDWSLVILGEGPLRTELEREVKSLKLEGRVQFPGQIPDPFLVLRRAGLFVLSSRFEGFPNALLEAMAAGLPVISFKCPSGPSDIIRDGIDGLLVPPGDVDVLASALDRLMQDPSERYRLARRAPEVLERFGVEKVMGQWSELITRIRN